MTAAPTSAHAGRGRHDRPRLLVVLALLLGGLVVALLYELGVFGRSSTSATVGSGNPATQIRSVPAFDGVELAGSNNVVIRVGGSRSVVVRADGNLLDRVTTAVRSRTLVVANTPGSFTARSPMSVEITVPALDALTLTGSGNITVDGIEARSLHVSLPGSGTLTGSGSATRLDVGVGGSGTAQFTRLVADHVRAAVSGSGSIFVTAKRSLDASVAGTGAILYSGHPQKVTKSVTGTGAIAGG